MFLALINATSSATGALVEDEGSPALVYAQAATVAGVAGIVRSATGSVTAQSATSSGVVLLIVTASGSVTASSALAAGSVSIQDGAIPEIVSGAGSPQAGAVSVQSVVTILSTVIAGVSAQNATVSAVVVFVLGDTEVEADVHAQDATVSAEMNRGVWVKPRKKPKPWTRIYPPDVE